jgi:CRISPR system Cascade subunit CasA
MVSLPEALAGLVNDQVDSFTGLMPHQRHAWFAFLVQLSAIALHRGQRDEIPGETGEWSALLRELTKAWPDDEPWKLVVEDVRQPAFMQPPVPEGALSNWRQIRFPAGLDILVTTKNHDVKRNRIPIPRPEHWVYALVTLQTMQGYSGSRSYGISRMSGGYSNRPSVALARSQDWGVRFRRDTAALLRGRQRILDDHPQLFREQDGLALLWLEPWDGKRQLSLRDLDPYYIEVCRRVRLKHNITGISAWWRSTATERIAATPSKGGTKLYTGDPWTPQSEAKGTALRVNKAGFTYDLLRKILLGPGYKPGLCLEARQEDGEGDVLMLAWALARGQGRTEGQHEKTVPVPAKIRRILFDPSQRSRLGERAQARVKEAGDYKSRVLRPALLCLLQGGPDLDRLDRKDTRDRPFGNRFDPQVDDVFFPMFWESVDLDEDEARHRWVKKLDGIGRAILEEAEKSAPVPQARRARAVAVAEIRYERLRRKTFPDIFEEGGEA